jgi:hypothetical protein
VTRGKTRAWIFLISIGFFLIYVVVTMINEGNQQQSPKKSIYVDPGMYKSGSSEWPFYGKSVTQLINDLNQTFSGKPKSLENEKKLYGMVGGMYIDKNSSTSTVRIYDLLEVPISMSYVMVNQVWVYGRFTNGGVMVGDPRLR